MRSHHTLAFASAFAFAVSLFVAGAAAAADVDGVSVKDTATVAGQPLVLNGAGLRTKVFFKVYVASLYVPAKAKTLDAVIAKGPRRIQLDMRRTVGADALIESLNEGLKENNTAAELAAVKDGIAQMEKIMKGIGEAKEGQSLTLDYADGKTTIGMNGAAKGVIDGDAFNVALTKIWLGNKPVESGLKTHLLGG